ncbi:amino acid permease-domain-containing protein [Tricladium varicosporioides]|nr:amino acid permease-domain-containing protein [Hymenoscyphus varicosporioides]
MAELENGLERHLSTVEEKDAQELGKFGYKQELRRDWGLMHNFGISFSIISVITGITTLFQYGLVTGGPGVMSVGWIVVSVFTMFVALGMAEIVSAIPTAGGPYYWSAMLAPAKHSAFASWITGWFNLLGQVAVTTGISFGLAGLISTTATVKSSYEATPGKTIGIYAAVLISHGIVNTFGVHILRYLNNTSILLHSVGVTSLAIAVLAKAPTHQSAKFVFATFNDGTGDPGWSIRASPAYVAACGALMSQYTLTGFDASAHLSEETKNASWSAPIGVISSVGFSSLFGFFVLMSFLFSIQDFEGTVGSAYAQPVLQIFVDIAGDDGAVVMMCLIMICVWHCGLFSMTSNSRMMFAFARDGGIPRFFHKVDNKFKSPIRTVWLAAFLSFCLALPSLGSSVAFAAATSIATIGLYISYGIPILIGLLYAKDFTARKGPFNLGLFSRPVAFIAVAWIGFITIIFCLPTANPVTSQTLNYTVVAVGIIAIGSIGVWLVTARRWFVGPSKEVQEAEQFGVDLLEPGALEEAERKAELEGRERGELSGDSKPSELGEDAKAVEMDAEGKK